MVREQSQSPLKHALTHRESAWQRTKPPSERDLSPDPAAASQPPKAHRATVSTTHTRRRPPSPSAKWSPRRAGSSSPSGPCPNNSTPRAKTRASGATASNPTAQGRGSRTTTPLPNLPGRGCSRSTGSVSYTHLRAHETDSYLVCRLLLEKKNKRNS